MKKTITILSIIIISMGLFSCAGGGVKQQKGTEVGSIVGAGIGAILGQAIGGDSEGTLLGAGIGAVVGGIAGNQIGAYMDAQERDLRDALAASEAASVQRIKQAKAEVRAEAEAEGQQRELDLLTATFKSEVLFDFDSATLKPGAYTELERVAEVLKKYPQTAIIVEGHTDSSGSEDYNLELSEKRAAAVKAALIQSGVEESRIESMGFGETQPVSSDDAMNRRVTIVINPVVQAVG